MIKKKMGLITENETFGLNRMTKKAIIDSCKKNKLYVTPHLNDVLYLHFQGYQKIEDLDEYTGLKCLWLESNAITEISGLDNQKLLKCLFLHNNLIEKIENLDGCKELDTLNLSHNQVMHLDNCGSDILPVLNTLNLANNYLRSAESIDVLRMCHHLSVLDLSNNRLDDILIVKIFADMLELKVLVLTGNPVVNEIPSYRKTLIVECKKLTYLDTRPVFPRDRACAEAWKRGGFQEERQENIRWNKEERREMLRSVNATLRMRNRGGGEPGVQLIPTDSSDDDEYYSREMRPKKQCEDVSSTEQWNILDEMMRNPEAEHNYQSCKVCGSAYCKYQHIENGEVVKNGKISSDEILESSNFTILWSDDNVGADEKIIDEKLTEASCSYTNDPHGQDNESEFVEEIISPTDNITKITEDCFDNNSTISISGECNLEMFNNIGNLIKVATCPEDCDSDDDENNIIETSYTVNNVEGNTTVDIPEHQGIAEKLPEHDNIESMCELLQDFKFDSSSDSVETNDTSLDYCINMEDPISSFRTKSNKELDNDFIKCNIYHGTEESFKPTDLSTLWEENSLAELDANDSIDSQEGKLIEKSGIVENNDLDTSLELSIINTRGIVDPNTVMFSESNEIQEDASLTLSSPNETENENRIEASISQCSITVEESKFDNQQNEVYSTVNGPDVSTAQCSINTDTDSSSNAAESDDPRNEDDLNENCVDHSVDPGDYSKLTILDASTALSSTNQKSVPCPIEHDPNTVQYSDFIRQIDHLIDDVNITHTVFESIETETALSSTNSEIITCSNENDSNIAQYSDFIGQINHPIDDVNITQAVIETIETDNSDNLINFACTTPNIESANQYIEDNLEVPVECNVNTCVFENHKTKSVRPITNQSNEFLISRIRRNCFELNEMMESKIERNQTTNIIAMLDDNDEPEEYEDVDSCSNIDTLGYSTFVASYEQFFNENEPKSAEFIKTVEFSSLCTEENVNSIDNVQIEKTFDSDAPNVDDIPAMKNFREYRAHLKSLLHRDSELRISCNELLSEITEKLAAIDAFDKPATAEDDGLIMDLPINSNTSLLTPSNSFYKICYDDPNSSLEYIAIGNEIEGSNQPDVSLAPIEEIEDDESKDVQI